MKNSQHRDYRVTLSGFKVKIKSTYNENLTLTQRELYGILRVGLAKCFRCLLH